MIHDVLNYIQRELVIALGVNNGDVIVGNVHALKEGNQRGLYLSLVMVEEEDSLRNAKHTVRINNAPHYQQPPVHLNLYLLCAADFDVYDTSLRRLSQTIELFQHKRVFLAANENPLNPFPADLEKLIFDYHNLNLEQLNHLWGVLGGAYFPSVLYKVRMLKVQRDETTPAPEITTLRLETVLS